MSDIFEKLAENMIELEGIEKALATEDHPVTNNLKKCRKKIVENVGEIMEEVNHD